MPIDAERWLASRGVVREPLIGTDRGPAEVTERAPGVREVVEAARQAAADAAVVRGSVPGTDATAAPLAGEVDGSDVEAALVFIRRSTGNAPQSEGRLRTKLHERGYEDAAIDAALERARTERLVDDHALLAALIAERRARGHADLRLRRDLRDRGFTGPQVDAAIATYAHTDPAAAAFALAVEQAGRYGGLDPEVAVRRTVGFLVRRGHGEALARKAARDAVYADREGQQVAGR